MTLKIGSKARNIHSNLEGTVVRSSSGASVSGKRKDETGKLVHFHTIGMPLQEIEKDWKRVYKFKFDMKDAE